MKASSCQASSFLTKNTVICISEPCQLDSNDTSLGQVNQNKVSGRKGMMDGNSKDQGSESVGYGNGKLEELGRQQQGNPLGWNAHG